MVVIRWLLNGEDMVLAPKWLQASYTDVRHRQELIDFIHNKWVAQVAYFQTLMVNRISEHDEKDEQYMGIYTNGQMIRDPIYGQIVYKGCLSNAFKVKPGQNPKMFLVEIKSTTGTEIAEHVIRPANVIPASRVKARCAQLLIIIYRLWKVLKRVEERRERRMVGKRMILLLM